MRTIFLFFLLSLTILASCNDSKQLVEVEVPLPEDQQVITPLGDPNEVKADKGAFKMMPLPYSYDALEPYIDAKTMETHYSKHHLGYTNKLNKAVAGTKLETMTIEDIFNTIDLENKNLRNNAGGYFNHNFFWEIMGPKKGGEPTGAMADAIVSSFGSFIEFKTEFTDVSTKLFGSGWTWLVVDETGSLSIISTSNQDNPLMAKVGVSGKPILCLDVWEHAYYLKHQNKRNEYIKDFFNVINWDKVAEKYEAALKE